jgi:hypothetical protein
MKRVILLVGAAVMVFSLPASATIINVPGDSTTIQGGINGANNGDTVLVHEGDYYERINFLGKGILVTSEHLIDNDSIHIQNTIIDADTLILGAADTGSVVCFICGEDSTSILQGFTITKGTGTPSEVGGLSGGGIFCSAYSRRPEIRNCRISENSALYGGGLYCSYNSSLKITTCDIIYNTATNGGGFAICGFHNSQMVDCRIAENSNGGWLDNAHLIIDSSVIESEQHIRGKGAYFGTMPDDTLRNYDELELNNSQISWSNIIFCQGWVVAENTNLSNVRIFTFGSIRLNDDSLFNSIITNFDSHMTVKYSVFFNSTLDVGTDATMNADSSLFMDSHVCAYDQQCVGISINNSTFNNQVFNLSGGYSVLTLANCIITSNGGSIINCNFSDRIYLSCCNFYGFERTWIEGEYNSLDTSNIFFFNPEFCYPDTNNFYISETSPIHAESTTCGQMGLYGVGCAGIYSFNLLKPDDDSVVTYAPVEFIWNSTTDSDSSFAASYVLWLDDDISFASPFLSDTLSDTTYALSDSLSRSTNYYWRIMAFNDYAPPKFSIETLSFYVNGYPSLPTIINPLNGAHADTLTYLTWLASVDPDTFDAVSYTIQIDEDSLFGSPEIYQSGLSAGALLEESFSIQLGELADIENLLADTKYFWRIKSDDNYGLSSEWTEDQRWFIYLYQNHAPDPPTSGFSPANDEEIISLTPTITWNNATDPDPDDHPGTLAYYFHLIEDISTGGYEYWDTTDQGINQVTVTEEIPDNSHFLYYVITVDDEGLQSAGCPLQWFWTNHYNYPPEPFPIYTPTPDIRRVDYYTYFNWGSTVDYDPLTAFDFTLQYSSDSTFSGLVRSVTGIADTALAMITDTLEITGANLYWRILAVDDDSLIRIGGIPEPEVRKLTILPAGDANTDGFLLGSDVTYLINYLRGTQSPPVPFLAGDANADCRLIGSDATYLIQYFRGRNPKPVRGDCESARFLLKIGQ